jgi:hypothetical protein
MRQFAASLMQLALFGWLVFGLASPSVAVETLQLEVSETAGIRRFGYPIALKLPEHSATVAEGHFRLRDGDKPVPAQFRPEQTAGGPGAWWLDFNLSMTPNEVRTLTLEYGPDVAADPEPHGLELKQTPNGFVIRNGPHITWNAGRDLHHLLTSVEAGDLQHLRREGVRLDIEGPNGVRYELDPKAFHARVIRSGPLAVAIRYEFAPQVGPLAGVKSTVDLTFPVSKSWVQIDWHVDDPRQAVRSARAKIAQNLAVPTDDQPTLVDFGASSLVYMSLTPGTIGRLQTRAAAATPNMPVRPFWEVLRGPRNRLEAFAAQPAGPQSGQVEGWAHSMDRRHCLALGVGEFGRGGDDSIEITAEGEISVVREFAPGVHASDTKSFRLWLHFVGFPPHLTAATSPQSMLSPLKVRVNAGGRLDGE